MEHIKNKPSCLFLLLLFFFLLVSGHVSAVHGGVHVADAKDVIVVETSKEHTAVALWSLTSRKGGHGHRGHGRGRGNGGGTPGTRPPTVFNPRAIAGGGSHHRRNAASRSIGCFTLVTHILLGAGISLLCL